MCSSETSGSRINIDKDEEVVSHSCQLDELFKIDFVVTVYKMSCHQVRRS